MCLNDQRSERSRSDFSVCGAHVAQRYLATAVCFVAHVDKTRSHSAKHSLVGASDLHFESEDFAHWRMAKLVFQVTRVVPNMTFRRYWMRLSRAIQTSSRTYTLGQTHRGAMSTESEDRFFGPLIHATRCDTWTDGLIGQSRGSKQIMGYVRRTVANNLTSSSAGSNFAFLRSSLRRDDGRLIAQAGRNGSTYPR